MNGTTPKAEIDFSSPVPLHEQVAAAIRRAIADGEAKPGKRLPPARNMAKVRGTVADYRAGFVFSGTKVLFPEAGTLGGADDTLTGTLVVAGTVLDDDEPTVVTVVEGRVDMTDELELVLASRRACATMIIFPPVVPHDGLGERR